MKKKLLICILSILCAAGMTFSFTACDLFGSDNGGDTTDTTAPGNDAQTPGADDGKEPSVPDKPSTGDKDNNGDKNDGKDPSHTHSYAWQINPKPTQDTQGVATGSCTSCDDEQKIYLPALSDSRYNKTKDTATCAKKGQVKYSIILDGATYTFNVETPATGAHNYKDGICLTCNGADPDYVPHEHAYEDKSDGTGHWTECTCGDKTTKVAHNYSYAKDDDGHWQICSVGKETTAKVAHTYVNGVCVCGAQKPANELDYALSADGSSYEIVGLGTVTSNQITVPAAINGKPVTKIADGAFKDNTVITGVTVLATVSVGKNAFENCTNLKTFTMQSAAASAARRGKALVVTDVEIDYGAFENSAIEEITFADTVKKISFSFHGCTSLKKVNYLGTVSGWAAIDMWGVSGSPIYYSHCLYINGQRVTDVDVDNIDVFSNGFAYSDITSVKIGSGVKKVSGTAFEECAQLVSAQIADGVEVGLHSLFRFCTSLENVKLPADLKVISQGMFEGCEALKQIALPNTLTHIDDEAFRGSGLTSITIPRSVVRIGAFAFEYCFDLQSVTFEDADLSKWNINVKVGFHTSSTPDDADRELIFHTDAYFYDSDSLESIILKDTAQEFKENKFSIHFMIRDINTEEMKSYDVLSSDSYPIYTVVEGETIPLSLSCSLCKGDANDWNGCMWSTSNIIPARS